MPGFYISNIKQDIILNNKYNNRCKCDQIDNNSYVIKRNTLNKFLDDKCFLETENHIIIIEGVILNKRSLIKHYNSCTWEVCVEQMINKEKLFFEKFRGSFSGAVFFKKECKWIIYTNHIGDKPIFYYIENGRFGVASQVNYLLDLFRIENVDISLNESAVYNMLTFGYMEQNQTYVNEIQRLIAGTYLEIDSKGNIDVKRYHQFSKNKYDFREKTDEEILDIIDSAFQHAIRMEFDKDNEYGYAHLVDLSGGLDSRMTSWVAYELGYKPQQNITYCKANYEDEIIAKQIASYCGHDILVKSLDDLSFIYDIEDIVKMNYGLSIYAGITGGKRFLESLNFDKYGLEHTGQLGDAILGAYCRNIKEYNKKIIAGTYSVKLIDKIPLKYREQFDDTELYKLYVRGFNGILCTHLIRQNYTEVTAPFLDVDFLNICYSIPVNKRINHEIYEKWIISKYPQAAKYSWEKIHDKIINSKWKRKVRQVSIKIKKKIQNYFGVATSENMNPFQYWYLKNEKMRMFIEEEYKSFNMHDLLSKELQKDIEYLFTNGTAIEKLQVLTALKSIQIYFGKEV